MTISTPVEWRTVMDTAPSGGTQTATRAFTAGRLYIAFVTQYRTDSIDPPIPTMSGLGGAAWTNITPNGTPALPSPGLWDSSSSSRRRLSCFKCIPSTSGTDFVRAAYASNPANCGIIVWEFAGADNVAQIVGGDVSGPPGQNQEISFGAPASSVNNVLLACVAANVLVNATARFEVDADSAGDSSGDADWQTGTILTDSNPTTTFLSGYYNGNPNDDRDPSWYQNTDTPSAYMIALEISAASVAPPTTDTDGAYTGIFGIISSAVVPPDPEPTETLLGVCPGNGVSNAISKWGPGIAIRYFQGGNFSAVSRPSRAQCSHWHHSCKPTSQPTDAIIVQMSNMLLEGDFVTLWHESDVKYKSDGNLTVLNQRIAMQTQFYRDVKRLREAGTIKNIYTACVLAGWRFRGNAPSDTPDMFLSEADVIGIDLDGITAPSNPNNYYDWGATNVLNEVNRVKQLKTYGGRCCYPEYAWAKSPSDTGQRIVMINQVTPRLITITKPDTICWFDYENPAIPGEPLTTSQEIAAWKAWIGN